MKNRINRSLILASTGIAALLVTSAALPACAADKVQYALDEAWVKPVVLPKPNETYAGAPSQVLLQDLQVNFDADGTTTSHTEMALRIQTPAGLQGAQSYVVWNPDTDTVIVHKVQILRGDQVIDVLANGQSFTVMRREQNLDRATLDGYLTGVLQPEGLRPGDTLLFSVSVRRFDPVWAGHGELVVNGLSQPGIAQQSIHASWNSAKPAHWRQTEDLDAKISKTATGESLDMQRNHTAKIETQDDAPARFNQSGRIEFSQFASWNEISSVLAPLYIKAAALPADSSLNKEIETIRATTSDKRAQAAMALHLVENQVRYVFLGMDLGGYKPADADTTWRRRFGDCKGKSILLVAMLKALDIEAEPALVNSTAGDGLDQRLPAMEQFDHVIVRAKIGGKVYWLDGTRLGDRDLDSVRPPAFRWALPIRDGGASLETIEMRPLDKPSVETFIRLNAASGLNVPAGVHVERILRGDQAIQFDIALRALPSTDDDKNLRGYWVGEYDWMTPRKVSAAFDAASGEERLVMDGTAKMEWDAATDGKTWRYTTDGLNMGWSEAEKRDSGPHRDAPVVLPFPYYEQTREEIILPKTAKGFKIEGDPVDKAGAGMAFHRDVVLKDGVVNLNTTRRALVPEVGYADAVAASAALTKLWKNDVVLVAPKSYHKAQTDNAKTTSHEPAAGVPKTADEDVADARQAAQQNQIDTALAAFNRALRLDPTNVAALEGRASILMLHGNLIAAVSDFELALKTDPNQWIAYNGLGLVRGEQARPDDAIDAFTKALAIYPNDTYALAGRAQIYLVQGKTDLARKDAEAARDLDPDSPETIEVLSKVAVAEGKIDEARDLVRRAIAASPDDVTLHGRMAELYENCRGMDAGKCADSKAQAVAEYDRIIAVQPSAYAYAMRAQDRPAVDRQKKLDDIDAGMKLDPTSNLPLLVRAAIWLSDKNYDRALEDATAAIQIDPKDTQPHYIRARIYEAEGKADLAVVDYDAVTQAHPADAEAFNGSCWARATHNIQLDKALADCEIAVKLAPKAAGFMDSRAFVKFRLGRFDDALADYDAALALEPKMAPSLYVRSLIKLKKGDKAGSEADLTAAHKISPRVETEFAGYGIKP